MPPNAPAHLLILAAASAAPGCRGALAALQLPALSALLAELTPAPLARLPDDALDTPAERALAQAQGLAGDDGRLPWAAAAAVAAGLPPAQDWAFLTPCHLEVGMNQVRLTDPAQLALPADQAEALMASMAPYLAEDGIVAERWQNGRWLAHGEPFRGLATASPERVLGEDNLNAWLPANPLLRRLQNEMQMLLYTHPVNDAREAQRLVTVNALWISGCGSWPAVPPRPPAVQVVDALRDSARLGDWAGWSAAWQRIDATACAALLQRLRAGEPVALTLCGPQGSRRFDGRPRAALARWLSRWRQPRTDQLLEGL
ncbi:phosphoglycerate mutase [Pseudorhodoferax sp.]|uniref:phosphoglycerate mutase n=1 Tax=Pseudorhodoferax sp. TaxID=1993553 RepID=UPI002DD692F2|nr:phosphoglycerate mutase [Pseudorhodoferax sp.]